jgi:hypothetical protein
MKSKAWKLLANPLNWYCGGIASTHNHRHCALTAIIEAYSETLNGEHRTTPECKVVKERLKNRIAPLTIAQWNDSISHSAMLAVLRELDI